MVESTLDREALLADSFIESVEIHDELGSTNDRAAELARDRHISLPAIIIARQQTAGRGRGQNSWWSTDGALTFSVLLETDKFHILPSDWPRLSLAVGVAVCDALADEIEAGHSRLGLKWPNDVYLDGVKVCGVLIESPGGPPPAKNRLIIGIGINVNNSWRQAPREVGGKATALCDASRREHDLNAILIRTLESLRRRIQQLAANDPQLIADWQRLCWLTEQEVEVHTGDKWFDGVCLGIAEDASLIVEDASGIHHVRSGSVRAL
jgi:BirA family transcriptional regulator, biotin operon repressor / biotin---[acetyl-CoA-carboxylase] ligase